VVDGLGEATCVEDGANVGTLVTVNVGRGVEVGEETSHVLDGVSDGVANFRSSVALGTREHAASHTAIRITANFLNVFLFIRVFR
jgi:hypothetical protein